MISQWVSSPISSWVGGGEERGGAVTSLIVAVGQVESRAWTGTTAEWGGWCFFGIMMVASVHLVFGLDTYDSCRC